MKRILIPKEDLILNFEYKLPQKTFTYQSSEEPSVWQNKCRKKLHEVLACNFDFKERVIEIHHKSILESGTAYSLIMHVDETLSIPAYMLVPDEIKSEIPVIAIQGHGDMKGVLGIYDDYHHGFGLELFHEGFIVLVPEIRSFGSLANLAAFADDRRLTYWEQPVIYSIVTDAFNKGYTLIGDTVQDLYAWASYICKFRETDNYSLAGISYGGDLALILAALDIRAIKTFASGTLGSMATIFDKCCNAPAHCIPNILRYMDRQEIAFCISPRSLCIHYGELDVPSPENFSASYNETAIPAFEEVKHFYDKMKAINNIQLIISPNMKHEMDNSALKTYLQNN
jgi:cephalosporin-C deacetylase-like acetyl esterase